MKEVQDPLAERYGRKNSNRKPVIVLASTLFVIFLVWAAWASISGIQPTPKTVGYELLNNHQIRVDFGVTKPADRAIGCAIQALKQDYGIVGYKEVSYPAGMDYLTDSVVLNTTEPAVTGLVDHCWFY